MPCTETSSLRKRLFLVCREQIDRQVSLFFYIADEGGSTLQISSDTSGNGRFVAGTANEIGDWEIHIKGQV